MFVLPPPPPRLYPNASPWGTGIPGAVPLVETSNKIEHPEGPEYQFTVGEGTYTLRESIHLATPPPHPSEAPIANPNPLSTAPQPFVTNTSISTVAIKGRGTPALYRNPTVSTAGDGSETTERSERRTSADTDGSSTGRATESLGSKSGEYVHVPEKFGGGNTSLVVPKGKKPKPKNNIAKSNSSFVSRIITHEHLAKRMAERTDEDLYVFASINRAFHWLDMSSSLKHEPLSKILFTKAHPSCHDVNQLTRESSHIDVIIGFSTSDIIWFDPMTNKYARINKNGAINPHPVTGIKWLPGSENLFLAAHNDGSLIVYDKEKEDAMFIPEDPPVTHDSTEDTVDSMMKNFDVRKSSMSRNQRTNPVSYWQVANSAVTAFEFSPDCEHLAVVSEDQCLRVVNFVKERLLDVYSSYYGGLTCVCWSPDGRYIVTGGQDDLVSIWSFAERRIVARCEGHHSWVSSVAFDPWRCDDRSYRFGSVGHDCRLLLWDFSVGMLHKPKAATAKRRGSISSHPAGGSYHGRPHGEGMSLRMRSDSNVASEGEDVDVEPVVHPVQERARTAVLPPVMSKEVDPDPLTQLVFREDSIILTCMDVVGALRALQGSSIPSPGPATQAQTAQGHSVALAEAHTFIVLPGSPVAAK